MATLTTPSMPMASAEFRAQIIEITDAFCLKHLDVGYAQLCRDVVGKLARKRPCPLLRGDLRIWASGVLYAMASTNFLFDPAQPLHLGAQQLAELLDVKKTTMANKGGMVRDLLKIGMMDPEFTHPDLLKDNPLVWTLFIDGLPVDVRRMPLQFQRKAFDMGLIPYVPGEDTGSGTD